METNIAQRTYQQMIDATDAMSRNASQQSSVPSSGLLSPRKQKASMDTSPDQEPAYRVAQYFNNIKQKRMEISRG